MFLQTYGLVLELVGEPGFAQLECRLPSKQWSLLHLFVKQNAQRLRSVDVHDDLLIELRLTAAQVDRFRSTFAEEVAVRIDFERDVHSGLSETFATLEAIHLKMKFA